MNARIGYDRKLGLYLHVKRRGARQEVVVLSAQGGDGKSDDVTVAARIIRHKRDVEGYGVRLFNPDVVFLLRVKKALAGPLAGC